jgi:hypothetical protein
LFATPELEALVKWVEKQGGFIHDCITIREGPLGRGVFLDGGSIEVHDHEADSQQTQKRTLEALGNVEQQTTRDYRTLYEIPEECYFDLVNVAKKSPHLATLLNDETFLSIGHEHIGLGIVLLAERNNPNSFWKAYLDTLPTTYPEQPLFWSPQQLQELQSPSLVRQFETSRRWLGGKSSGVFHELVETFPQLFGPHNGTSDFVWAYYTMTSRAFGVSRSASSGEQLEEKSYTALLPFVDLLNHAFTEQERTSKHEYTMKMPSKRLFYVGRAAKDYLPRGIELMWKYKEEQHYSAYYLFRYGMLPPNPDMDFVMLRYRDRSWPVSYRGHVEAAFFDSVVLSDVAAKVEAAIQTLPSSLEDDLQEKKEGGWGIALEVRIRYKTILHKLLNWLQEMGPPNDGKDEATIALLGQAPASHALYELDLDTF